MNNNTILDLISEAYEYVNEVKKYGTIDESDEEMLDNALAALAEAEKEIENEWFWKIFKACKCWQADG